MCLVAFAINASKRWPLVIASNRDEFFNRPTLPMAWWKSAAGHTILSGRDERAGGTWLGMTPGGRIAWLTNVRQASTPPAPRSRGDLVVQWLEGDVDAARFMETTDPFAFGGFNLLLGDVQKDHWTWLSNRTFDPTASGHNPYRALAKGWSFRTLVPGIYGLSNAALDTPWPKTRLLKASLNAAIAAADQVGDMAKLKAPLWQALASQSCATSDELPDTGLPIALERALSSAFVDDPGRAYGTRCSTLLVASLADLAQADCWDVQVEEKTFLRAGLPVDTLVDTGGEALLSHRFQWKRARI